MSIGFKLARNKRCTIAIGNPSRKYAKLHTVAAKNHRDHTPRSLYYCLFVPHIYGCYSSRTSRSWWITHSTQRQRRFCNSTNPFIFSTLCLFANKTELLALFLGQNFPRKQSHQIAAPLRPLIGLTSARNKNRSSTDVNTASTKALMGLQLFNEHCTNRFILTCCSFAHEIWQR